MELTHLGNNFGLIRLFAKRDKYGILYEGGVLEESGEFIQVANDTDINKVLDRLGLGPLNCNGCNH
jgi:hypothetical protein